MVYWVALGEAIVLAINGGIEPELAFDILADSSNAIVAAKGRLPIIRDMLTKIEYASIKFSVASTIKYMKLMEQQIVNTGGKSSMICTARTFAEEVGKSGFGHLDESLISLHGKIDKPQN